MIKCKCKGGYMESLGEKIKDIRLSNNLKQSELADILHISEKTISSWENNRTTPDLNMIYKISNYFKKSFYYLISDDYIDLNDDYIDLNNNEIEIKLKVDRSEYERILNLLKNTAKYKNTVKQIDTYFSLKDKNSWLRTRNENGKCIFNLKKKINNSHYEKYDVIIDNLSNLNKILQELNIKELGTINKERTIYVYKNKYEFSFDNVENIGLFIEIEIINQNENYEKDTYDLLNLMKELKIDLNMIDGRKYIDYLVKEK